MDKLFVLTTLAMIAGAILVVLGVFTLDWAAYIAGQTLIAICIGVGVAKSLF